MTEKDISFKYVGKDNFEEGVGIGYSARPLNNQT
jgi:hypothetical protein